MTALTAEQKALIERLKIVARNALRQDDVTGFDAIWDGITELTCAVLTAKIYKDAFLQGKPPHILAGGLS